MKRVLSVLVGVLCLTACGNKFTELHPGKLGEKDLICKVKVDTSEDHKNYVYDIIECVEGKLP